MLLWLHLNCVNKEGLYRYQILSVFHYGTSFSRSRVPQHSSLNRPHVNMITLALFYLCYRMCYSHYYHKQIYITIFSFFRNEHNH